MTEPIITINGLLKRYGDVEALRGVTVDFPPGPVGLLGPNGAGKSTMIKLLLGLLVPTEGTALIAGCDPSKDADRFTLRERVGYMPESDCLLPNATAVELVTTLARLTGLSRADAMTRAHEVLDYVELEEARYRKAVEFSTGMKQRMKLAQALVHDPNVLLLDEPTNGLDPKGRRHMLELIDDLGRNQGKNIVLCSHLLKDMEETCDHVVVMDKGRVVEAGTVEEMTRADALVCRVWTAGDPGELIGALNQAGWTCDGPNAEGRVMVQLPEGSEDADELFYLAARHQITLTRVEPERSTLEEVFLRAIGATVDDSAHEPTPEEMPA